MLTDIYTGGILDIKFQSETKNEDRKYASQVEVKSGIEKVFGIDSKNSTDTQLISKNYNRKLYYKTRGGEPSKGLVGEISLDSQNVSKINISNWQTSNNEYNAVLVDFGKDNGIIPIYELVDDIIIKEKLKSYIDKYIIDNQINLEYIPQPIHRYFSIKGDHFYTTELDIPKFAFGGYMYEGVEFYAFNYKAENTVPIYGFWNGKDHFYSPFPTIIPGYILEGIAFYASKDRLHNTIPIHRYFKLGHGDNYYTKNFNELRNGAAGYIYMGVSFYAYENVN